MSRVPAQLLAAASPMLPLTRTTLDASERAQTRCADFVGIDGLRRLQDVQANQSPLASGCGWQYKQAPAALVPEVNQAAFGTQAGASAALGGGQGGQGGQSAPGARWYWDLEQAEKEISKEICGRASSCSHMKLLGENAKFCGFCKATGKVIPVVREGSTVRARYPKDATLACPSDQIVISGSNCPVEEGFEAMAGADALASCTSPLTRDCIILAARNAGCSDKGSLIAALEGTAKPFDTKLGESPAFQAYQESSNPGITRQMLKDGSTSVQTAIGDFAQLITNTQSQDRKLALAARDLCLKAGAFDAYNFCAELTPQTVITKVNFRCLEEDWLQAGGTRKGKGFETLSRFMGKTFQAYMDYRALLKDGLKSQDKTVNASAILEFMGMETATGSGMPSNLPRSDDTRGAEVVWFDTASEVPIVLRSDINLSSQGPVLPTILEPADLQNKYRVPQTNVAFTAAFELRPDVAEQLRFYIISQDGFMLGHNQNPFENTKNKAGDWGAWRLQGPTHYQSSPYDIAAESSGNPNLFVLKWFSAGGWSAFRMYLDGKKRLDPAASVGDRQMFYITQEPAAPWLQYELCERPNEGSRTGTGFFERRWNGQCAIRRETGMGMPSFDVKNSGIVLERNSAKLGEIPGNKGYVRFSTQDFWHTQSMFSFKAFKTITLLVRPLANLADGTTASVFQHVNFKVQGASMGLYLTRRGTDYVWQHYYGNPVRCATGGDAGQCHWTEVGAAMNQWNFLVIQYVGDEGGVRTYSFHAVPLTELQRAEIRRGLFQELQARQNASGPYITFAGDGPRNAGYLCLGGTSADYKDAQNQQSWTVQSFSGDVAWLHGFRQSFRNEQTLAAEIQQGWMSRWPRANF